MVEEMSRIATALEGLLDAYRFMVSHVWLSALTWLT
jgi:hypothetical protein